MKRSVVAMAATLIAVSCSNADSDSTQLMSSDSQGFVDYSGTWQGECEGDSDYSQSEASHKLKVTAEAIEVDGLKIPIGPVVNVDPDDDAIKTMASWDENLYGSKSRLRQETTLESFGVRVLVRDLYRVEDDIKVMKRTVTRSVSGLQGSEVIATCEFKLAE